MSKSNKRRRQYLKDFFTKCDSDGSGEVHIETLLNTLQNDEEVPPGMVKRMCRYFNSHSITDESKINVNKFMKIMDQNTIQNYLNRFVKLIVPPQQRRIYKPVGRRARSYLGDGNGNIEPDGAYDESYCFWPPQMGMILITIIQVIFFIIDESTDAEQLKIGTGKMAKIFIYDPLKKKEAWRFLTYMFVHVGYAHITVNAVVQLIVGFPLESVHKWWRVLIVYVLGVIAGSLLTSIVDPYVVLAGASGGVYAIIAAHIATVIMNFKDMSYGLIHLCVILSVIIVDVGSVVYNRYTKQLDETIAYTAHFGGALAGLLVGIWVLRNIDSTTKEKYIWWIALVIYLVLMGILIILNILWQ